MSGPGRSINVMTGGGQFDRSGRGPTATTAWAPDAAWSRHPSTEASHADQPTVTRNVTHNGVASPPGVGELRHRRWVLWAVVALAAIFSVTAITLSAANWLGRSTQTNPPAPVPLAPTVSESQISAAKKAACDASVIIDEPLTNVQRALAALPDRNSPEAQDALGRYQMVTIVETEYLKSQTGPAAPKAVKESVDKYVGALLAEVDAATRGLSDADLNIRVAETKAAGEALATACN